jgi:hypothetical protein
MTKPKFEELPFNSRPDLTPFLIHLTKNTSRDDNYSGYDNLVSILKTGEIWGSGSRKGFVKGARKATCFMDVPFTSLKYVLTPENADPEQPRYEPYGLVIRKPTAYDKGCRPVLYLSKEEEDKLCIPKDELWRVVRFEVKKDRWISWLHEREWRCPDNFMLPEKIQAVLVKTPAEAHRLSNEIATKRGDFSCIPPTVIPLQVMCQGLLV